MSAISTFPTTGMGEKRMDFQDPSSKKMISAKVLYENESVECDGKSYFNICLVCISPKDGQTEIRQHFQIETTNENLSNSKHIESIHKLIKFSLLPLIQGTKKHKEKTTSCIKLDRIFTCPGFTATPRYCHPTTSHDIAPSAHPREERKG